MNIGIVFAMEEELIAFKKYFSSLNETNLQGLMIYDVKHKDNHLYFIRSGVGKVNAAYSTTKLMNYVTLDALFNCGVAGGISAQHEGLVLGRSIVYHDVDVTSFGSYSHGQIPGLPKTFTADDRLLTHAKKLLQSTPYSVGTIASGDQFMVSKEPLKKILELYPDILAVEMESAAIAHVATLEAIPFFIIRAISDVIGEDAQSESFSHFLKKASEVSAELLYKMVDTPWR